MLRDRQFSQQLAGAWRWRACVIDPEPALPDAADPEAAMRHPRRPRPRQTRAASLIAVPPCPLCWRSGPPACLEHRAGSWGPSGAETNEEAEDFQVGAAAQAGGQFLQKGGGGARARLQQLRWLVSGSCSLLVQGRGVSGVRQGLPVSVLVPRAVSCRVAAKASVGQGVWHTHTRVRSERCPRPPQAEGAWEGRQARGSGVVLLLLWEDLEKPLEDMAFERFLSRWQGS